MLTDLVLQAENGRAVDRIADQYGLSRDETVQAIEALVPAFSAGLQRNTRDVGGQASLLQALGSGRHPQYVEDPDLAFSDSGLDEGRGILGHVFGNRDVSRGVAAQAAARTGLSESLLKRLLPALAPIILGALVKGLTGRSSDRSGGRPGGSLGSAIGDAAGGGLLGSILGSLADGFLSGGGDAVSGRTRRAPTGRRRRTRRTAERTAGRGGGLEDLIGDVLGGALGGALGGGMGGSGNRRARAPRRETSRREAPRRQRRTRDPLDEFFADRPTRQRRVPQGRQGGRGNDNIFGDAIAPGGRTDRSYQREVGSVFDQLLGE